MTKADGLVTAADRAGDLGVVLGCLLLLGLAVLVVVALAGGLVAWLAWGRRIWS
jgi:hypothetical protein